MNVGELIKELEKLDKETIVLYYSFDDLCEYKELDTCNVVKTVYENGDIEYIKVDNNSESISAIIL